MPRGKKSQPDSAAIAKPNPFAYHDYRSYLKDWLAYRASARKAGLSRYSLRYSMRTLAKESGLAVAYLSMILSGARPLSANALAKLVGPLDLTDGEATFLELLRTLEETDAQEVREAALRRMQQFPGYQKLNPRETEVYRYLSHWYYVAIREMVALLDFRDDAEWIQSRLRSKVPLKDIAEALQFLKASGHIQIGPDGRAFFPQKNLECFGGVHRIGLAKFHREMLGLTADSIVTVPSAERHILGHTFAVPTGKLERLKEILGATLKEIAALEEAGANVDSVYHVTLAAVPLTVPEKKESEK